MQPVSRNGKHVVVQLLPILTCMGSLCRAARTCRCGSRWGSTQCQQRCRSGAPCCAGCLPLPLLPLPPAAAAVCQRCPCRQPPCSLRPEASMQLEWRLHLQVTCRLPTVGCMPQRRLQWRLAPTCSVPCVECPEQLLLVEMMLLRAAAAARTLQRPLLAAAALLLPLLPRLPPARCSTVDAATWSCPCRPAPAQGRQAHRVAMAAAWVLCMTDIAAIRNQSRQPQPSAAAHGRIAAATPCIRCRPAAAACCRRAPQPQLHCPAPAASAGCRWQACWRVLR